MRRDGRLVPISANKETLLIEHAKDGVILTVPGTKQSERIFVPQGDITNMDCVLSCILQNGAGYVHVSL